MNDRGRQHRRVVRYERMATSLLLLSPALPVSTRSATRLLTAVLCFGAMSLTGCDRPASVESPVAALPPSTVPTPPPFVPPSAARLYEMVAPIALYPDKLVAQVLAGATYPQQITQADQWLTGNALMKAGQLADAAQLQSWDPSVKSLTAFKRVLDQMANNLTWTTALGQTYYNDPEDVLNAIQVMRQRASQAGQLKSNPRLRIAAAVAVQPAYAPTANPSAGYSGSPVIAPPTQLITIEPAETGVVYVPAYNPERIYGEPVAVYPGYVYSPPVYSQPAYASPGYSNAQIVTAGALTFGLGIVVGAALERHDWGWHAWDMNWGRPNDRGNPGPGSRDPRFGPGPDRPAVVYNRTTYVSHSNTVMNNTSTNNYINNRTSLQAQLAPPQPVMAQPQSQPQRPQPLVAMQPSPPLQRTQLAPQQIQPPQQTQHAEQNQQARHMQQAQQVYAQQTQLQAQQQNLQRGQLAQQARQQAQHNDKTQRDQRVQAQNHLLEEDQRVQRQQQEQQNRQVAQRNQQQAQIQAHAQIEAQAHAQNREHAQAQIKMQQEQMHRPPAAPPRPQPQQQQQQARPPHPPAHQEVAQHQRAEGHASPRLADAHSKHEEPHH